ncbi:hypothetical protein ACH5RR_027350 [Cinchona calisaya]|uniref:Uncharacterized protein n=1 Tax=Cinchona calisaya TaxID=153742 RepID=A0ABD2Z576_9GENT
MVAPQRASKSLRVYSTHFLREFSLCMASHRFWYSVLLAIIQPLVDHDVDALLKALVAKKRVMPA